MNSDLIIKRGSILIYRVFDVGEEISLEKVRHLLDGNVGRFSLSKDPRKAMIIKEAPLLLNLGDCTLTFGDTPYKSTVSGKLWDYGALSICFQISIPENLPWKFLIDFSSLIEQSAEIDKIAREKAKNFTLTIESAIKGKIDWPVFEDYVIYFLENIEGIEKDEANSLLTKANIPSLILAETKENLSEALKKSIIDSNYQYGKNDLLVLDWNSAMIYDTQGQKDVADVIEFSLTHLLEMRFYDDLLDERMDNLYTAIRQKKGRNLLTETYSKSSEDASQKYIEFCEFLEKVDNSLKTVGDFFLATVFRAASTKFRSDDWKRSIDRKMNILAQISQTLQGEINSRRSHWLEIVVIILIAIEILGAALPWFKH